MRTGTVWRSAMGFLSGMVACLGSSCAVNSYPEEVVEWTGTTTKGGEFSCWVHYIDPLEPGWYPDRVCLDEFSIDRSQSDFGEIQDWQITVAWGPTRPSTSEVKACSKADTPETSCEVQAWRGDGRGGIPLPSLRDVCDPSKAPDAFGRLADPKTWRDDQSYQTEVPAPYRSAPYMHVSCTVVYSDKAEDDVKLNDWWLTWDGQCADGVAYDSASPDSCKPSADPSAAAAAQGVSNLVGVYSGSMQMSIGGETCEGTLAVAVHSDGSIDGGTACGLELTLGTEDTPLSFVADLSGELTVDSSGTTPSIVPKGVFWGGSPAFSANWSGAAIDPTAATVTWSGLTIAAGDATMGGDTFTVEETAVTLTKQ